MHLLVSLPYARSIFDTQVQEMKNDNTRAFSILTDFFYTLLFLILRSLSPGSVITILHKVGAWGRADSELNVALAFLYVTSSLLARFGVNGALNHSPQYRNGILQLKTLIVKASDPSVSHFATLLCNMPYGTYHKFIIKSRTALN